MFDITQAGTDLEGIDFHDGEVMEIRQVGDDVIDCYRDWREKMLHLKFTGVISMSSFLPVGSPEVSVKISSDRIDAALRNLTECYGADSNFAKQKFAEIEFLDEGQPTAIVFTSMYVEWPE